MARLEHPNVVPLYDFWREPGAAYLVFRYLRGGSVQAARRAGEPWPLARVTQLVEEVGAALGAAHTAGIVHGDVRPANVLLDAAGHFYLADFGLAGDRRRHRRRGRQPAGPARLGYADARAPTASSRAVRPAALATMAGELLAGPPVPPIWEVVAVWSAAPSSARPASGTRRCPTASPRAHVAARTRPCDGAVDRFTIDLSGDLVNPYEGLRASTRPMPETSTSAPAPSSSFSTSSTSTGSWRSSARPAAARARSSGPGRRHGLRAEAGRRRRHPRRRPIRRDRRRARAGRRTPGGAAARATGRAGRLGATIADLLPADDAELVLVLDQFEELWTLPDPVLRDRLLDALATAARRRPAACESS